MTSSTLPYQQLVESFVEGKLSAIQFEAEYLRLFKYDTSRSKEAYPILSNLFWAVEDFCVYPELRDESDLDENQLLQAAKVALEVLRKLETHTTSISTTSAMAKDTIEISNERLKQVSITTITGSFTNIGKKQPELKSSNKLSFVDKLGSVADFIKKLTTNDESVTNLVTV
jgi:hypothetical protein